MPVIFAIILVAWPGAAPIRAGQSPDLPADVFAPASPAPHCQPGPTPMLSMSATSVVNGPPAVPLPPAIMSRTISQHGGSWVVRYTLRCPPAHRPATVALASWVANSRAGDARSGSFPHARPAWSEMTAGVPTQVTYGGKPARSDVLAGKPGDPDECREVLTVAIDPGDVDGGGGGMARGDVRSITLRLDHAHEIYGPYDPLLGVRDVAITFAPVAAGDRATGRLDPLRDLLPLDRESSRRGEGEDASAPPPGWREADFPEDRRDATRFISAPDSLLIVGDAPGYGYYRLPERAVRYSTRYRLSFHYYIAPGSDGEFRCRVAQYREGPNAWKVLSDGGSDVSHKVVGRWVRVDRVITTEPAATTMAVDFRVTPGDAVAEVNIDEIKLDRADGPGESGP